MGNNKSKQQIRTRGTSISEIVITVNCTFCKTDKPGSIKFKCSACESWFFELESPDSIKWEWITIDKYNGFCHDCKRKNTATIFFTCRDCKNISSLIQNCSICMNSYRYFEEMSTLPECGHSFCNGCWKNYFESAIIERKMVVHPKTQFYTFKCPESNCNSCPADPHFIKQAVSVEMYEKYKLLAAENLGILQLGTVYCPHSDCGVAMIPESLASKITCYNCCRSFCLKCKIVWQENHKCIKEQNQIEGNIKTCPNSICKIAIEKTGGCNYMRCNNCNFQFCWVCLKEWPADLNGFWSFLPLHGLGIKKKCSCNFY